jgi:hypothetical protein
MREDFSESDLPFRADILDWATTSEPFRRVVEQNKVVIQPATQTHEAARVELDLERDRSPGRDIEF